VTARFSFHDGERLIRFGAGALGEARALVAARGFEGYCLLTTARAAAAAPDLAEAAGATVEVPAGPVPEVAAAVRERVGARPIVALGGGRVVDAGKAVASVDRVAVAAVPTTLAGSPFTPFHRLPLGAEAEAAGMVRPSLVVADPDLMASQPPDALTASAMNSLAHAVESLYGPLANPIAMMAALRAVRAFAEGLDGEARADSELDRPALAYAATLAGYAVGTTGFAIHHATCQTLVRLIGTPHAQTNAVMLPHSVAYMADRAPAEIGRLATALGDPDGNPAGASAAVARLARRAGVERLGELGIERDALPRLAMAISEHPATANTPPAPPVLEEIEALLMAAL
jgi:maleylacetate reductase